MMVLRPRARDRSRGALRGSRGRAHYVRGSPVTTVLYVGAVARVYAIERLYTRKVTAFTGKARSRQVASPG